MNYKKILKHAKKITKPSYLNENKPVLKNMYMDNNTITMCDGHRLLKINHEHDFKNTMIDPTNNDIYTHDIYKYPETNSLIPDENDGKAHINLWYSELTYLIGFLKGLKAMKMKSVLLEPNKDKSSYTFKMYKHDEFIVKETNINMNMEYIIDYEKIAFRSQEDVKSVLLKLDYLIDALEFCKDCETVDKNFHESRFYISLFGELKPVILSNSENDFKYLILPIRQN